MTLDLYIFNINFKMALQSNFLSNLLQKSPLVYLFLDRLIILGNHRDAWVYGAADPSSGTATTVEVARALGWLKKKGNSRSVV